MAFSPTDGSLHEADFAFLTLYMVENRLYDSNRFIATIMLPFSPI